MKFVFATLLASAGAVLAQVGAPVMGLVPEAGSLRVLYGIPAAGFAGDPVPVGRVLSTAQTSSAGFALGIAQNTGELLLIRNAAQQTAAEPIANVAAGASRIVMSPGGTAALAVYESGRVSVIGGLPGAITVRLADISFLGAPPASLAVSDDAQWIVGAWGSAVYALGPAGQVNLLPTDGAAQQVTFFHGKSDVALITANQVALISDIGSAAVPKIIWQKPPDLPPDAVTQVATGLAVSADNQRLTVAGSLGGLYTMDLAHDNAGIYTECGCTTQGLASMGASLYRISAFEDGSWKLYDAATGAVLFVPLAAPAAATGVQQ